MPIGLPLCKKTCNFPDEYAVYGDVPAGDRSFYLKGFLLGGVGKVYGGHASPKLRAVGWATQAERQSHQPCELVPGHNGELGL